MRRLVPFALVIALVAAACGDDTPTADPALVASLSQRISDNQSGSGGFEMTDPEVECFATGIISLFGAERITAALDLDFSAFMATATAGERREVVDIMLECVDLGADLARELGAEGTISAESARCLADTLLASDAFRDATAESFVSETDPFDDPALVSALLPAMLECLSPPANGFAPESGVGPIWADT
jgi:hypothetical protein